MNVFESWGMGLTLDGSVLNLSFSTPPVLLIARAARKTLKGDPSGQIHFLRDQRVLYQAHRSEFLIHTHSTYQCPALAGSVSHAEQASEAVWTRENRYARTSHKSTP